MKTLEELEKILPFKFMAKAAYEEQTKPINELEKMPFGQIMAEIICEGITKQQQEKGQRLMSLLNLHPVLRAKKYLDEKWSKIKITKKWQKDLKSEEYHRLSDIANILESFAKKTSKEDADKVKKILGFNPPFNTVSSEKIYDKDIEDLFSFSTVGGIPVRIVISKPKIVNGEFDSGWMKTTVKSEELEKIINKLVLSHEHGHLYNWIKRYIDTGEYSIPNNFSKLEMAKEEGEANEFAISGLYRKDRRELFKNSDLTKEKLDNAKEDDYYTYGLAKHSPTTRKVLDSIEKEKQNKRSSVSTCFRY